MNKIKEYLTKSFVFQMTSNSTSYFLKLSSQPIVFEPISNGTSVFYDKDNQQLFCVRGSGAMGKNTEK